LNETVRKQHINTSCWMKLSENKTSDSFIQQDVFMFCFLTVSFNRMCLCFVFWQFHSTGCVYVLFSDSFIQQDVFMCCFLTVSFNRMCLCVVLWQFNSTGCVYLLFFDSFIQQYVFMLFSGSVFQQDVFMCCFLTVSFNRMYLCVVFWQFNSTGCVSENNT
jgi:hypothetical protein